MRPEYYRITVEIRRAEGDGTVDGEAAVEPVSGLAERLAGRIEE